MIRYQEAAVREPAENSRGCAAFAHKAAVREPAGWRYSGRRCRPPGLRPVLFGVMPPPQSRRPGLLDRHLHRPAGVLRRAAVGTDPRKPRPAFKRERAVGAAGCVAEVEAGDPVAVAPLRFVGDVAGIGVRRDGNLVAKAVFVVAGPGERAVGHRVGARLFVERMPPAAVDRVDDRRAGE
jgi:hypothetical protein